MNRKRVPFGRLILLALVATAVAGCSSFTGVKHLSGAAYSGGYKVTVAAPSRVVRDVAHQVVADMELEIIQDSTSAVDGIIEVRSATGEQVFMMYKLVDQYQTYLEIHKPRKNTTWLAQALRDQIKLKSEMTAITNRRESRERTAMKPDTP